MRILVATTNPGKLRELREILGGEGVEVVGLDALAAPPPEPVEDGGTFEANARIKARGYAAAAGLPALADDSGLEVDALDGAPGVDSAHWTGRDGNRGERDARNNARLLDELAGVPAARRGARFICAMCLASPDGIILAETRGTFEGVIVERPKGEGGFGYDPLLLIPELGRTAAELDPAEKNARSHRGAAARAMAARLRALAASA
ncbi:MAG TPA: RdgB/HAM1 family non-canonical purine NTP pyrophosphatase [Phycisphaerales bacterium]|nr:RdgB/HAM1 family non-canonical purine NTP pyrophosphatase [Phycisphaerales bacterium]HMP37312.1 RdgB/HAM1 family non-canonical purine NTP pyrophosphatase [Phycisphaerales bacterium]